MLLSVPPRSLAKSGDSGCSRASRSPDRQRRLVRLQRLGRLAGVGSAGRRCCCGCRQVALELGDGGVGVGQPSADRQRRLVRRFSASAGLPVSLSRLPMLSWLPARSLWNSVTVGLASASFRRIASAASYGLQRLGRLAGLVEQDADVVVARRQVALESVTVGLASASLCRIASAARTPPAPRPACRSALSRLPMLLWLSARSLWNSVTVGLASASLCRIASAASCDAQRLGRLAGLAAAGRRCCCGSSPGRSGTR